MYVSYFLLPSSCNSKKNQTKIRGWTPVGQKLLKIEDLRLRMPVLELLLLGIVPSSKFIDREVPRLENDGRCTMGYFFKRRQGIFYNPNVNGKFDDKNKIMKNLDVEFDGKNKR